MGVQYSRDDQDLVQYLQSVNGKLMGSFQEHHVCAGLYQLADKFAQVFDPARFSVAMKSYSEKGCATFLTGYLLFFVVDASRAIANPDRATTSELSAWARLQNGLRASAPRSGRDARAG